MKQCSTAFFLGRFLSVFAACSWVAGPLAGWMATGCGGSREKPSLTFVASLLPAEKEGYAKILEAFSQQTGLRVNLITQQYEQVRTAIEAESQGGRGEIDLVELDLYQLPLMKTYMQPLAKLREGTGALQKQVPAEAWTAGIFGQPPTLYFVPHRLNWQALVYDAEKLSEPPADWDALLSIARDHPGAIGLKCARYEGLACDLFPFLWQAGGDPLRPDSPEALRAMEFLRQLGPYLNPAARSYKENTILSAQEHREILLHPNWSFVVPLLNRNGLLPRPFGTAPLPAGPKGRATVLGGGYLGIPATAPHPDEAGRLADFLTTSEIQKRLMSELGWFPIRRDATQGISRQDQELYSGFLAMRDDAHARPNVPYYNKLSQVWQDGFYQIVFEGAEPASTLKTMQGKIDALAREAGL